MSMNNLGEQVSLGKYYYRSDTTWKRKLFMMQERVKIQIKESRRNEVSWMTESIWDMLGVISRTVQGRLEEEHGWPR